MRLNILDEIYAIAKLPPDAAIPEWAHGSFVAITRTPEELSIVCANVPDHVEASRGWKCLKVPGPLDFALTGILASIASPLAAAGIPIFAISTFDTDYILVREADADRAVAIIASDEAAG